MLDVPEIRTVLAFDFGLRRIGVAVGNYITKRAEPLAHLPAREGIPDWVQVGKLITTWQPDLLLVGEPLNMDGSEQSLTLRARKFARRLHGRFGLPVEQHDERLTTKDAQWQWQLQHPDKPLGKGKIDSIAACLILESWWQSQK